MNTRIAELGLTRRAVSDRAGVNATIVRDVTVRGTSPSIVNFAALAEVLAFGLDELYFGPDTTPIFRFPLCGQICMDGFWEPLEEPLATHIPLPPNTRDLVAIRVVVHLTNGLTTGDIVFGVRLPPAHAHNYIGVEAILQISDGQRLVGWLWPGADDDRFTIRFSDPKHPDLEDVKLEWIAPIEFVARDIRGNFRNTPRARLDR